MRSAGVQLRPIREITGTTDFSEVFLDDVRVPADALLGAMIVASGLESIFAYCVGCRIFALLMRVGVIPQTVCLECANVGLRPTS